MSNKALGIFDSGIGGLTVANAISEHLPNEQIIYFGDIAHLPYGDKSAEAIEGYSIKIAEFLETQNCKGIIIACNTASSVAYKTLHKKYKGQIEVFNVIDPVIKTVVENDSAKKVGIIGTLGTIQSKVYSKKLLELKPNLDVRALATPLLASMIEAGFYNNKISKTVIETYLSNEMFKDIDTLILACTHYPLIKKEIKRYFKDSINVIDSTDCIGIEVGNRLNSLNLQSTNKLVDHHFYVSDLTTSFEQTAKIFYGEKIKLEHKPLWD